MDVKEFEDYKKINKLCPACKNYCFCYECSKQRKITDTKRACPDIPSGEGRILEIEDFQEEKRFNFSKKKNSYCNRLSMGAKKIIKKRMIKNGKERSGLIIPSRLKQTKKTSHHQRKKISKNENPLEDNELNENKILNINKNKLEIPLNNVHQGANVYSDFESPLANQNFQGVYGHLPSPSVVGSQYLTPFIHLPHSPFISAGTAIPPYSFIFSMNTYPRIGGMIQSNCSIPSFPLYEIENGNIPLNQILPLPSISDERVSSPVPSKVISNNGIIPEPNRNKTYGSLQRKRVCSTNEVVNIQFPDFNPNGPN